MTAPFPTRKQEEWRYADLEALKPVWEQFARAGRRSPSGAGECLGGGLDHGDSPSDEGLSRARAASPRATRVRRRREGPHLRAQQRRRFTAASSSKCQPRGRRGVRRCYAANIGTGLSTNEIVTNVRHIGVGGRSRQTIRSVLNGKAVGSYLGKVEVARGAQQTDAEQSVKAMLLDRGATANCKPELEIFADDVKCAHGATVGELDAMQLFYAESRGLDPASAARAAARRLRHGPVG